MAQQLGNQTNDISITEPRQPGAACTLVDVLKEEFRQLHNDDPQSKGRPALGNGSAIPGTEQQQPIADPSLAPADERTGEQSMKTPEVDKTPSQQTDMVPEAKELRRLWSNVHDLSGDGRTALCLSGGGVRSAAFNLGVLQGLARLDLLDLACHLVVAGKLAAVNQVGI